MVNEIESQLAACGVFIALIGQQWTQLLTAHLQDGDEDYVHRELDLGVARRPAHDRHPGAGGRGGTARMPASSRRRCGRFRPARRNASGPPICLPISIT